MKSPNKLSQFAGVVGRGLIAGLVGTAAMTISSTVEMKMRNRKASDAPAKAAGRVLGVQPRNPEGAARFGNFVHWSYGPGWGVVGSVLSAIFLSKVAATGLHFASVWGSELATLPAMGIAPPIDQWGAEEIAIDGWHHIVYVLGVAGALRIMRAG